MVTYFWAEEKNMRRDVFQAIADPTRREIIHILSKQTLTLNGVAEKFSISRPAISRHIKILFECGLININTTGRERVCEIKLQRLRDVNNWIKQYESFWNEKFDNLEKFLAKNSSSKKIKTK